MQLFLLPDSRDDVVHCPSVQLVVGEDLERYVVLLLIALDGLFQLDKMQLRGRKDRSYSLRVSHRSTR